MLNWWKRVRNIRFVVNLQPDSVGLPLAYVSEVPESNSLVGVRAWYTALYSLIGVIGMGLLLAALLYRGLADPPRPNWIDMRIFPTGTVMRPFTLETGAAGIELTCGSASPLTFQVRRDGYFSASDGEPAWQGFLHTTRERNLLVLYSDEAGQLTFRINHEVAWQGTIVERACTYRSMSGR
ncbi:MAG: hypothetical protein SF162_02570 [bacterium]|nr:hypothetical protein [bacterium]